MVASELYIKLLLVGVGELMDRRSQDDTQGSREQAVQIYVGVGARFAWIVEAARLGGQRGVPRGWAGPGAVPRPRRCVPPGRVSLIAVVPCVTPSMLPGLR